jgi:hypothetical protein
MLRHNLDLIAALLVVMLLTAIYLPLALLLPATPGSLIGHGIGIAGFVLMLATETLYSLRKRSMRAGWGPMNWWLSAHVVTGIVGPTMVLLHTSFQFAGIAGVTTLLMVIVVASGFVGRYIYTAVPRTATGIALEPTQLAAVIDLSETQLAAWLAAHPGPVQVLAERLGVHGTGPVAGRAAWEDRRLWRREVARLDRERRREAADLRQQLVRRRMLQRQAARYTRMRRLLGVWHALHVPLGMMLFAAGLLHIVGALYFR